MDTAWRALRDGAGLQGLRFHDLRHTMIADLAEIGLAHHVLKSNSGHLSRRIWRLLAHPDRREAAALDALDAARARRAAQTGTESRKANRPSRGRGSAATSSDELRHSHVTVSVERVSALR